MKTQKKVSHWYKRGEAYAKESIVIANRNLPPHAVDFYLGALSVVKSSPGHPLKDNPKHPFWMLLTGLVEDGKITPKQLGIVDGSRADSESTAADSDPLLDEKLDVVFVASAFDWGSLKPLTKLCHAQTQIGVPVSRSVMNAMAVR